MTGEGLILSVDFGTAYSKLAVVPEGVAPSDARRRVRALPIGDAAGADTPLMAPSVAYLENEEITFGPLALDRLAQSTEKKREPLQSFKLLLGAADLQAVMATKPNRLIDPDGAFLYRDLIVLYLAYLMGLADEVLNPSAPGGAARALLRYTRPGWYSQRTAADHVFIRDLFSAARGAVQMLGPGFWRRPVSFATARKALKADPAPVFVEGGLFEATAVAVCHLPDPLPKPHRLLVMDIGAGTTDIGAYVAAPGRPLEEIAAARHVMTIAGDAVDRALMDVLVAKARHARKPDLQAAFWRSLLGAIRTQKETLFDLGRMAVRFEGKSVVVTVGELERNSLYKSLSGDLAAAFTQGLEAAAAEALAADDPNLSVVLAGGGAALPFAKELQRKAKPAKGKVAVKALPSCPHWAEDAAFAGALAPQFSKLAIALGAALAPRDILIAGGVRF